MESSSFLFFILTHWDYGQGPDPAQIPGARAGLLSCPPLASASTANQMPQPIRCPLQSDAPSNQMPPPIRCPLQSED